MSRRFRFTRSLLLALSITLTLTFPTALWSQAAFVRGDANGTGKVDISDAIFCLTRLFVSGEPFPCDDAADSNDDGEIDISDAVLALAYQFLGGVSPRAPFPDCGLDPTGDDRLGCEQSPSANCAAPPPASPIVQFLRTVSLDGTEPCCLPGLGRYSVRHGTCASLGGTLATDDSCAQNSVPSPGLQWMVLPPVTAVDAFFPVAVAATDDLELDYLTLDLYTITDAGTLVGPVRIESMSNALLATDSGSWMVDVGLLPRGDYTLVATAWKSDNSSGDSPVAVLELPGTFRAHPTAAQTLSLAELAALAVHSPANDPEMDTLLWRVQLAEGSLQAVQASLHSPKIDSTRNQIRGLEGERAREQDKAAGAHSQADDAQRRAAQLREELAQLVLVNRYLDTYFGPADLQALKDLIRRREDILAGVAQDDRQALSDALDKKRDRLAEVNQELADKKAKLEQLKKDHAALGKAIREQYHFMRGKVGDNIGHFNLTDAGVTYDVSGIIVTRGGAGYILYAPISKAYKAEKAKLDAMITDYENLWKSIQDCEKEIAELEKEKTWLEGNIAKLESGAGEVDEIDSVLDEYFDVISGSALQAPHLQDLINALRASGNGWLADLLEELLGFVPRTCAELEEFEQKLQALRDRKHAQEAAIADEIKRAEAEAAEARRREAEAERRRQQIEEEIRAAEERLRQAEEAARVAAEEEYRRQQAAAEEAARQREAQRAHEERIRELRERVRNGDEGAMQELLQALGLTLLDELVDDLPLGTLIGGIITAANIPACLCDILKAMLALFSDSGHFRTVLANEVIRLFRTCADLPWFSSVELGAEQLANAVDRMSPQARRKVCEALQRAIAMHCP